MELSRLIRILKDRWLVLVIAGVAGAVLAVVLSSIYNRSVEPVWEATAPVRFELEEGQTFADLANTLTEANNIALFAANEILSEQLQSAETYFIIPDQAAARLLFIARGSSADEAANRAKVLRQTYFDVDPESVGDVDELLAAAEADVRAAEAALEDIQPVLSAGEQELLQQHLLIDQELAGLTARLAELTVADASATQEQRQLNDEERARIAEFSDLLQAEQAALGPRPDPTPSAEEQMKITALQRRIELSTLEYERLYLRQLGVGNTEPVALVDVTPKTLTPAPVVLGGMVGGVLIALFFLTLTTRIKKPIWLTEDVHIPVLGAVPARRVAGPASEMWYDTAESGPRKASIQRLRSAVEAQLPVTGGTFGIAGHNLHAQNLQALATDLACSMASAGTTVMLIDGDFASTTALGEYRVGAPSLSAVLSLNPDSQGFEAEVASMLTGARASRPGLAIVPSGPAPASPADALAGRQFRRFVDKATGMFDVVIVVVGDVATPGAQVALQRLGLGLLVLTPGRSLIRDVDNALFDVGQRQVGMLGAVFLERSVRQVAEDEPRAEPRVEAPQEVAGPALSPFTRLAVYDNQERHVEAGPEGATDPADLIAAIDAAAVSERSLGVALLAALEGADSRNAYEAVADYLVSRVEDMLTLATTQGPPSDELTEMVTRTGFIPLTNLSDHRTVGAWISAEISRETTPSTALAVVDRMERILSDHDRQPTNLDHWLSSNFFKRHLLMSGGNPSVWHFRSDGGEVQLLVAARHLDQDLLRDLIEDVTIAHVDELERLLRAADARGDVESVALIDTRIAETRRFGEAIKGLAGLPSSQLGKKSSRGVQDLEWVPDWSLGMRANLAPFQMAGVLAIPVLSDDELSVDLAVS